MLPRLRNLSQLNFDGNTVSQRAAELLIPATGSLQVFTCSGRGISEGTYKDLYKDGTGGKKKGKKKK